MVEMAQKDLNRPTDTNGRNGVGEQWNPIGPGVGCEAMVRNNLHHIRLPFPSSRKGGRPTRLNLGR